MARRPRSSRNDIAVPAPQSRNESVSIREIKNGFIIERASVRRGKYVSEQEFSPGRPVITASAPPVAPKAAAAPAQKARPRSVSREVGYLTQKD